MKSLKEQIAEAKKDTSLNETDRAAKIKKAEEKIDSLQKKCKKQTETWLQEQREDEKKQKRDLQQNNNNML